MFAREVSMTRKLEPGDLDYLTEDDIETLRNNFCVRYSSDRPRHVHGRQDARPRAHGAV